MVFICLAREKPPGLLLFLDFEKSINTLERPSVLKTTGQATSLKSKESKSKESKSNQNSKGELDKGKQHH